MNKKILVYRRWLALAFFVFAAGCFCSCAGRKEAVSLIQASDELETWEDQQPDHVPEISVPDYVPDTTVPDQRPNHVPDTTLPDQRPDHVADTTLPGIIVPDTTVPESISEQESCFVHVCGEVVRPGVYELSKGQRLYEAIELAGGFTPEAASAWLNLAEPVCDGMKLEVPSKAQAAQLAAQYGAEIGGDGSSGLGSLELTGITAGIPARKGTSSGGKVNINTAPKEELMTLRGIGEARAEDIIRYRESHGGFQRIEDIMKVSGIKDAAFEKIKGNITV